VGTAQQGQGQESSSKHGSWAAAGEWPWLGSLSSYICIGPAPTDMSHIRAAGSLWLQGFASFLPSPPGPLLG
jgi:hypothetical protein